MKLLASPPFHFRLGAYTFGHFAVEFVANYFLITIIGPHLVEKEQMLTMLLIYNACDYGPQVLIGLADDILRRNHFFAAIGPALIICSYFFRGDAWLMAGVLGVGWHSHTFRWADKFSRTLPIDTRLCLFLFPAGFWGCSSADKLPSPTSRFGGY